MATRQHRSSGYALQDRDLITAQVSLIAPTSREQAGARIQQIHVAFGPLGRPAGAVAPKAWHARRRRSHPSRQTSACPAHAVVRTCCCRSGVCMHAEVVPRCAEVKHAYLGILLGRGLCSKLLELLKRILANLCLLFLLHLVVRCVASLPLPFPTTCSCLSSCSARRYSLGNTLTKAPTSTSQSASRRLASTELVNLTCRWMMLRSVTSSCVKRHVGCVLHRDPPLLFQV